MVVSRPVNRTFISALPSACAFFGVSTGRAAVECDAVFRHTVGGERTDF
jgi:hypothetical protein